MATVARPAGLFDAASPGRARWLRWTIPSFSDLFFVSVLIWLFVAGTGGWTSLLLDGGAGG
ncbi:MAG TPA: hypothetical protein DEH78_10845, partial [Solibacterales bacterium]|nr:hypothetical protein [Bryobacterales bacterium]